MVGICAYLSYTQSMEQKRLPGIIIGILLFAGAVWWAVTPRATEAPTAPTTVVAPTVVETEYGLTFSYPDGYDIREQEPEEGETTSLVYQYTLQPTSDTAVASTTEAAEGLPVISVQIYTNPDGQSAADRGSAMTDFLDGEIPLTEGEPITVGDYEGISYRTDGLYAANVVWLSTDAYLYRLAGEFITEDDPIMADFQNILDSVELEESSNN